MLVCYARKPGAAFSAGIGWEGAMDAPLANVLSLLLRIGRRS